MRWSPLCDGRAGWGSVGDSSVVMVDDSLYQVGVASKAPGLPGGTARRATGGIMRGGQGSLVPSLSKAAKRRFFRACHTPGHSMVWHGGEKEGTRPGGVGGATGKGSLPG